jgi:hypothetical protein
MPKWIFKNSSYWPLGLREPSKRLSPVFPPLFGRPSRDRRQRGARAVNTVQQLSALLPRSETAATTARAATATLSGLQTKRTYEGTAIPPVNNIVR